MASMEDAKIIGIGGLPRSGKDTLAELFIEAGFFGLSFGDVVRGFCYERHKDKPDPISVENMTETSNWLRKTRGPDVILQEALKQYQEKKAAGEHFKGLVLWSIRAPIEVDFILSHHGEMIWVEASDEVRHERALQHLRPGEVPTTLEDFRRQEALQWKPQPGIPEEIQMNTSYVKAHATKMFVNNENNLELFLEKTKALIQELA
jgi:dephospho-CoA kinase